MDEISLVSTPANRRSFAVIKSALPQEITEFLGADAELEKTVEEAQAAVTDAVKKLAPYMEDFPDDLAAAIRKLAAWATAGAYPEAPADSDYGKSRKGGLAKGGGTLWPSLNISMLGLQRARVDIARDDDGLPERVPERRGISKQAKGQGDFQDDDRSENVWPSLS